MAMIRAIFRRCDRSGLLPLKWLLAIFFLITLDFSLLAGWEEDLRQELWDLGYRVEDINQAIEYQRTKNKSQSVEKIEPRNNRVRKKEMRQPVVESHKQRSSVGHSDQSSQDDWIRSKLSHIKASLIQMGWNAADLEVRLDREKKYFKKAWTLYKSNPGEVEATRRLFEYQLASEYVTVFAEESQQEIPEKARKGVLSGLKKFVDEPPRDRFQILRKLFLELRIKTVEEREEEFRKLARYLTHQLRPFWVKKSLARNIRFEREGAIRYLCEDLAVHDKEKEYVEVLEKTLKQFKRKGYSKSELDIIRSELMRVKPS